MNILIACFSVSTLLTSATVMFSFLANQFTYPANLFSFLDQRRATIARARTCALNVQKSPAKDLIPIQHGGRRSPGAGQINRGKV